MHPCPVVRSNTLQNSTARTARMLGYLLISGFVNPQCALYRRKAWWPKCQVSHDEATAQLLNKLILTIL